MSFSDALRGIVHVVRSERNMRIHLLLGLLVVIFAAALGVGRLELVGLMLTIGLVLVAELFNTVVEEVVDLITPEYHPLAGTIKNIAAGAVLLTTDRHLLAGRADSPARILTPAEFLAS